MCFKHVNDGQSKSTVIYGKNELQSVQPKVEPCPQLTMWSKMDH